MMKTCEHYGGTERMSPTATKIKCPLMPDGGMVYENKDPAGKIIATSCWNEGKDCQYKNNMTEVNNMEDIERTAEQQTLATVDVQETHLSEMENRAATLHRRILVNSQIAAQSLVAIAKDLRTMKDEKLYTALGCTDFDEYCEQRVGIKQRQAYNFMRVLDKYGERQLEEISHLGIAKLVELTALDEEDRQQLIESGEAEEMSVRELKEEIARLNSRCEQLTLDLGEADNKSKTELELLTEQLEGMKARLKTAEKTAEYERAQREGSDNNARELEDKVAELSAKLKEAEERPIDVAVQQPSEQDIEKIREEARAEEKKMQEKITAEKDKLHKDEIKKIKEKADSARITAVEAARKQEAEKFAAEMEKLRAENAVLQSNAQKPAPTENKALLKYRVSNIQNEFNAAVALLGSFEPEEKEKYKAALKTTAEQILEVLSNV